MGYYSLIDTNKNEVNEYASKIGILITLLNYLDFNIQIFIEAILEPKSDETTAKPVIELSREFSFAKRVVFLDALIKSKHKKEYSDFPKIKEAITTCNNIRNNFAHSQMYFWDNDKGTHMFIHNMKKTNQPPEKSYEQVTRKELDKYIELFEKTIKKFEDFTYELGYFQGHRIE